MTALVLLAVSAMEHYERANALFQQQKFAEAGAALDQALTADPNLVPALTLRGKLAMGFNKFDVARSSFERAAVLAPKSAYVQFLLGFFYYVDNDFKKALAPLEAAIKLNPKDSQAYFYLGLTREGLAEPDIATINYERSLALADRADTRVAFARLLFSLGKYGEAQRHVARALELDAKSRDAHYEQGRLHFEAGRFAESIAAAERALSLPGIGTMERQIHFLLARAYGRLGDAEKAAAHRKMFEASGASLRR